MGSKFLSVAVFGGIVFATAPALAWSGQSYTQPTSNEMAVRAYPSKRNHCPAGLQPVVVGGVICCGQPTHVGYQSNNHPKRRAKPNAAYGKGFNDGYVATGKGYGEGYKE